MIELANIHRNFQVGDQVVHALDDVTLNIDAGEYVSIMGPSGSGKSTLLNLIGLLDRPSSGTYRLNGQDVTLLSSMLCEMLGSAGATSARVRSDAQAKRKAGRITTVSAHQ